VPVTVTLKLPEVAESKQDRVEVREVVVMLNAKLAGFKMHERPIEGETVGVKATVPVNPWRPVTVMVEVALLPRNTVTLVGLALTVKS
jgi:hypothetical protein